MARYFCRVCYNTNGWRCPSGSAFHLEGPTHAAHFAFAWEEWNFDFQCHTDADGEDLRKFGWIEGFYADEPDRHRRQVPYAVHDVMLYTYDRTQYKVIGRIRWCEHIHQSPRLNANLAQLAEQINAVGGNVVNVGAGWEARPVRRPTTWDSYPFLFRPNIQYSPNDCSFCIPIPIDVYDRYGALLVDGNRDREPLWNRVVAQWHPRPTVEILPEIPR